MPDALALCGGRAVGLGESGRIYFGGNVEFPGVPLNQSVRNGQSACLTCIRPSVGRSELEHKAWKRVPAARSGRIALYAAPRRSASRHSACPFAQCCRYCRGSRRRVSHISV